MSISDRTRKLLWGRAASRCSICRVDLVVDPGLAQAESLIGEECHIVAESPDGPRGDADYPEAHIDSYINLILLCRNHHKEIDDLPSQYPIQRLSLIKRQHEHWVRTTLGHDGGAFPVPTSDVLLTRFSLPAVFGFLVETILSACKGVVAADRTFDTNRRELRLAERLCERLVGLVPLLAIGNPERAGIIASFVSHSLVWLLGEAKYLLPSEDEVAITRSIEMYKDALNQARAQWAAVRTRLLDDPVALHEYHELAVSDERWPLLGFASGETAQEWLVPTTKSLFDEPGAFELELLRKLASEGEADVEDLVRQGMPRGIIIELFNRLARDKWASLKEGRIRATALSQRFIANQLAMRGDLT